jgi:hypothetical protein
MLSKICTVFCVATLAIGFSSVSMAAGESAEPATLIVYRADESVRTERLGLDVHMDEGSVGRLNADNAVVITQPAGQYTLATSIKGTEPLVIDLKPGQTHYVHSDVDMRGAHVKVTMTEVEEQVARIQQPTLGKAI